MYFPFDLCLHDALFNSLKKLIVRNYFFIFPRSNLSQFQRHDFGSSESCKLDITSASIIGPYHLLQGYIPSEYLSDCTFRFFILDAFLFRHNQLVTLFRFLVFQCTRRSSSFSSFLLHTPVSTPRAVLAVSPPKLWMNVRQHLGVPLLEANLRFQALGLHKLGYVRRF